MTKFDKQLGETYTGLKGLPVYAQALAISFNLSRLRDKRCEPMNKTLTDIWTIEARPEAEKKTAELIAPYLVDKKTVDAIEAIMGRRALVNTALLGLFKEARKRGGVFTCAQILWLKKIDRTLWYTLQKVGLKGAGSRAHYSRAHYFAEKRAQRAIAVERSDGLPHVSDWDVGRLALGREPMLALDAIDRGIIVVSADHRTATVYLEECLGEVYRHGWFPDRKIEVEDGIMLYRAGFVDTFGRVTVEGQIALAAWRTATQEPPENSGGLWERRAAALFNAVMGVLRYSEI